MSDLHSVRQWAHELIAQHLDDTWSFDFDHARRRAGLCSYTKRRITVSRYLAARYDDDENRQILLHEIAHALVGPAAAHGPAWRRAAAQLGYTGGRTHPGEAADELAPWVGECPSGHVVYRHRRTTRRISCAVCSPTFDPRHAFTWTHRTITPATRRAAATPRR